MDEKHIPQEMNQDQVRNILKYIDATQSEKTKRTIFGQLGLECFHCGQHAQWMEQFKGDIQSFLDGINVQRRSKYWESLTFSEDKKVLVLTGRKVEGCACAFADCSQPPKALCSSCCKSFLKEYFKTLLGQEVEVKITEAYLLGDERCSATIHLL